MCWEDAASSKDRHIILENMHAMLFSGDADRKELQLPKSC